MPSWLRSVWKFLEHDFIGAICCSFGRWQKTSPPSLSNKPTTDSHWARRSEFLNDMVAFRSFQLWIKVFLSMPWSFEGSMHWSYKIARLLVDIDFNENSKDF